MTRLYCEAHGREHEADSIRRQEQHRQNGESILVVKGRLISGPWLCDRCNAQLAKGDPAYLASAFPAWLTEQTPDYDFGYEREYFAIGQAEVAVYGADWPAATSARRMPSRPGRTRGGRPLCALDLRPKQSDPVE